VNVTASAAEWKQLRLCRVVGVVRLREDRGGRGLRRPWSRAIAAFPLTLRQVAPDRTSIA
jgi:hypothetical protein